VIVALTLLVSLMPPSFAEEVEVGPQLSTRVERPYMWIDGYVPELDTRWLRIVLLAPGADGTRSFWQRCSFPFNGSGRYSCGFEIGRGSDASRHPGEWVARLVSDDGRLKRLRFTLP
jgi:hypothetical protein